MKPRFCLLLCCLFCTVGLSAQNAVTAVLADSQTGEPVSFATVSLTREGSSKVYKYVLSGGDGAVRFEGVRNGSYSMKAELLGYKDLTRSLKVEGRALDLGTIKMDPDSEQLEGAKVTDVGNPIIIKKDTVEYNASSFKTTDNDVLEDLLKKLPGIEVSDDGTITHNGQTINKITIGGKTFFLDDPQLASKNIPAKIINSVKVVNKKSEQAEFTGIDDGEEETVIDLSVRKGMLNGSFGNVMAGAGHDLPATEGIADDWRYQAAGFLGNFTEDRQLSVILNANNTNNRGFNDLSGNMMGGMRGGGRGGWTGNGITTSYMAGGNGAWTLFDKKMDLGANYLFNHTGNDIISEGSRTTYLDGSNLIYDKDGTNNTISNGHRFGIRLDHVFSKNTSILFEPRIEFGSGSYSEKENYTTRTDYLDGSNPEVTNYGNSSDEGFNKNFTASGFALLRQRLGKPGRTLTVMSRYSFSKNNLNSLNESNTWVGDENTPVNQNIEQNSNRYSLWGRATYTEPLLENLYLEGNYSYSWSRSNSNKSTYNNLLAGSPLDPVYSNDIINETQQQNMGVNLMYQKEKSRVQLGFSAIPVKTYNSTTRYNSEDGSYVPKEYTDSRWKFAPTAMLWWDFSENANARMFYRGNSNQPSTTQLMPVPDNTDPLNVTFGNPSLKPYFSHNLDGMFRFNNKKTFASMMVRLNANFTQDPIVNATWYNNGSAYSIPMNGPASANANLNSFSNFPIGKTNFSISNMLRANWSRSSSYVGSDVDMTTYNNEGYYAFMDEFLKKWDAGQLDFSENTIRNIGLTERLRFTYRNDDLELTASGRTRMNNSKYTLTESVTTTWNNQVRLTANWTWDRAGLTFKGEGNYNWYAGYTTPQSDEYVLNAEIQKLLFKKKMTLALKCYDILGQAKQLSVTDAANYHSESLTNTLGRYIILSLTYRFGNMDRDRMRGPGGPGGPGGPPPGR